MTGTPPLAAVILALDAAGPALADAISAAMDAGAQPVVVVLHRAAVAPAGVRVARVADGASAISALRAGMALLTNTPARLALLLPGGSHDLSELAVLVDAARQRGAGVTAFAGADLDRTPVIVARDAWLELMTLGEQGIGAVAARRGLAEVER